MPDRSDSSQPSSIFSPTVIYILAGVFAVFGLVNINQGAIVDGIGDLIFAAGIIVHYYGRRDMDRTKRIAGWTLMGIGLALSLSNLLGY